MERIVLKEDFDLVELYDFLILIEEKIQILDKILKNRERYTCLH